MTLDRNIAPQRKEIELPNFIQPKEYCLQNGTPLYVLEGGSQEVIAIEFTFNAGTFVQDKILSAGLTNNMLLSGTAKFTANELADKIDFYGAYTQVEIGKDICSLTVYTMNKYLGEVLSYIEDVLENANFPQAEFETALAQRRQQFLIGQEKVQQLSRKHFNSAVFGNTSYGLSATIEDYDKITRDDIQSFFNRFYKNSYMEIIVSGHLPDGFAAMMDDKFGKQKRASDHLRYFDYEGHEYKAEKIFQEKDDALQSSIRIGRNLFSANHEDFFGMKVLTTLLGGYFGSRLMSNLREDKGYTYGVGASMMAVRFDGVLQIATEVGADVTNDAVKEIYHEVGLLREEEVSAEELSLVKNYMLGKILKMADGPFAQANLYKNLRVNCFDFSYFQDYIEIIQNISSKELKTLAEQYLQPEDLTEVVVGKR